MASSAHDLDVFDRASLEPSHFEGAKDLIRQRLGNDFFKLTRSQFTELVAMHISGNDWIRNTDGPITVEDNANYRQIFVTTSKAQRQRARGISEQVTPISWPLTRWDPIPNLARHELARRDPNYRPNRYHDDTDNAKLALIQAELAAAVRDDFHVDEADFRLDPTTGQSLPYPAIRTYDGRVLNFNQAMVFAVRDLYDGQMPRYAGIFLHGSLPQLAIRFSLLPVAGYHLVSPESDYNSYRVHAQSSLHRIQRRLRENEELDTRTIRLNGRRRCHQVGAMWVLDYTEPQV